MVAARPGRFVTLEGGEGVGKSTQTVRLAEALKARGLDVVLTREPGGSPGAEAIRSLLLGGETDRWTAESEALLFAAARADHVARVIRPALERGEWVLCDRFLDSSLAYQGGAGGIGMTAIRTLHEIGSRSLLPDRTLLLDLPASEAKSREQARDEGGGDRFGRKSPDYHEGVVAAFRELARSEPARYRIVDASGTPEAVTERLVLALDDLIP